MNFEFALGHRDGSISGPFPTERDMWAHIDLGGTPLARFIKGDYKSPYYDLDPINGLCYANPIYKKAENK